MARRAAPGAGTGMDGIEAACEPNMMMAPSLRNDRSSIPIPLSFSVKVAESLM